MTREDVKKRVDAMRPPPGISPDPEEAHGKEDDLYFDVLRVIAAGGEGAAGLAVEALKTREFITERWCA